MENFAQNIGTGLVTRYDHMPIGIPGSKPVWTELEIVEGRVFTAGQMLPQARRAFVAAVCDLRNANRIVGKQGRRLAMIRLNKARAALIRAEKEAKSSWAALAALKTQETGADAWNAQGMPLAA